MSTWNTPAIDSSADPSRFIRPAPPASPPGSELTVDQTHARQTEHKPNAAERFALVTKDIFLTGTQTALRVAGADRMAAAVRDLGGSAAQAGAVATGAGALGAAAGALPPELVAQREMMREGQIYNTQLMALQEEIQQENRRFSTLSNVSRARHDTAKAAVSNIRA